MKSASNEAQELILGLDPGLSITGYAVLRAGRSRLQLLEAGVLRAAKGKPIEKRLAELYSGVDEILETHSIQAFAIEQLYSHYERPRTAILMGHARGIFCLAASRRDIPVYSYAATKVKKMLTGAGRAPKLQMQQAVQQQLGLSKLPEPADVADAIAVALCHAFHLRLPIR